MRQYLAMPLIAPCLIALLVGANPANTGARVIGASSSLAQRTQVTEWTGGKPRWRPADFSPASAMDGRDETSWCEGAPGPGIGEWLEVQIDQPVEHVVITGGFRKI